MVRVSMVGAVRQRLLRGPPLLLLQTEHFIAGQA